MDTRTGAIARFETSEDARRAGHKLALTEEQAEQLMPLTRSERIAFAKAAARRERKEKRKAQRAARKAGRR